MRTARSLAQHVGELETGNGITALAGVAVQIARVSLVRVASLPMTRVARAVESAETRGLMKAVVEAGTDRILGAAVLGIEGGEIATVLQVAMMGGLPYTALKDGVFAHPTLSESLNNLFMAMDA